MHMTSLWVAAVSSAGALAAVALNVAAQTGGGASSPDAQAEMQRRADLKPVSAFAGLTDPAARSAALFQEAGKVITSPRCANCHPADRPAQGDDRHPHMPVVARGPDGHGEGLACQSCHTAKNVWAGGTHIVTVPGNPKWGLAPREMAWQGKALGEICNQIKDPARNGGRSLAQIHEHMAHDELVAWAWSPGEGRTPAPGTQAQFGELIQAWIDSGAKCPTGGPKVPDRSPPVASSTPPGGEG